MDKVQYPLLSASEKRDALEVAEGQCGEDTQLLGKDTWIVATPRVLFEAPFGRHLVFEGGTSLSKVWRATRRFSEDIDTTYDIRGFAPDQIAGDKALVFKATERIVSAQPWYQGGFRANIVAYAIARISRHVEQTKRAVDFEAIWRRQAPGPMLRETIAVVAERVHDVLVEPPEGMRNVTEWAKKQACWSQASAIRVEWPVGLNDELVSAEDRQSAARSARREQRELNGIEAQMAIVNAGGEFWRKTLKWGRDAGLLSPSEIGILGVAANVPQRLPTERQSLRIVEALTRLQDNGYREELPPPSG